MLNYTLTDMSFPWKYYNDNKLVEVFDDEDETFHYLIYRNMMNDLRESEIKTWVLAFRFNGGKLAYSSIAELAEAAKELKEPLKLETSVNPMYPNAGKVLLQWGEMITENHWAEFLASTAAYVARNPMLPFIRGYEDYRKPDPRFTTLKIKKPTLEDVEGTTARITASNKVSMFGMPRNLFESLMKNPATLAADKDKSIKDSYNTILSKLEKNIADTGKLISVVDDFDWTSCGLKATLALDTKSSVKLVDLYVPFSKTTDYRITASYNGIDFSFENNRQYNHFKSFIVSLLNT